jgi:hypothetical protein
VDLRKYYIRTGLFAFIISPVVVSIGLIGISLIFRRFYCWPLFGFYIQNMSACLKERQNCFYRFLLCFAVICAYG